MDEVIELIISDKKIVKQEYVGDRFVSTVMLLTGHEWELGEDKKPLFFETMIFGNESWEQYQERYSTYQEALAGHNALVEKLKQGLKTNDD